MYGYLTIKVATVLEVDVKACGMLLHPCPVLVDIGSIDDEEEVVLAHLVDQQIVDGTTILVAHHTIIDLTYGCASNVVGKDVLHIALCIPALHRNLSHVGDIEESNMFANSGMLGGDTSILIK